ncbi:MAG TPA: polysulfide reductase NrfD [Pseudomonadota bacterium]|jgi:molybdopterin-containing oxidoreductase family membrane subunit|nr:polysulfide reductase NrfD [Pseudomonadota bacterium]
MSAESSAVAAVLEPEPLLNNSPSFAAITDVVCRPVEIDVKKTPIGWILSFLVAVGLLGLYGATLAYLVATGVGVWGNNNPIYWAWDITNFVWWIGIGHAGTLISAILFLFRQKWRTAINRFAEAMTVFAVLCALQYPFFHTGRPWLALYWLLPFPNQMEMWPNFRSPLMWDVFAISTYGLVSAMFWYVGLIPDLATLRDRAKTRTRSLLYGIFAMGWRGSNRHWQHYERAYLILAGLSTPLVLSVHSVVSFDFATSVLPGWHATIFPPYFVAGAVFSGFGLVMTLMLLAREFYGLKDLVTMRVLENMNKIMLVTGTMVGYAYSMEFFIAWYGGNPYERFTFINRAAGPYAWAYWTMVSCNVISPQLFWFRAIRRSIPAMFVISIFVNIGMWFERFVIISTSLHRDFTPAAWGYFRPTWIDVSMYLGTFGLFFTLFLLFLRFLPMIAISEIKGVSPAANPHAHDTSHDKEAH